MERMEGFRKRIFALCSLTAFWVLAITGSLAQESTYTGPSILPPAPGAIEGGNPFQGLGRSDDPGASREGQYGFPTYNNSNFNAHGMNDRPAPSRYSESWASYPHTDDPPFAGGSSNSSLSAGSGPGGLGLGAGSSANASTFSRTPNTNLSQGYQAGSDYSSGANPVFGGNGNAIPGGFIPTSMLDSPSSSSNSQVGSPNIIQGPSQPLYGQAAPGLSFPGASAPTTGAGYANQGTGYGANSQFAPGFGGQAGFGTSPSAGASAGAGLSGNPGTASGLGSGGPGTVAGTGTGAGTAMGANDPSQSLFQNQDNSGSRGKNEHVENRGEAREGGGTRGGNDISGGGPASQTSLLSPSTSTSKSLNTTSIADPLSFSDRASARIGRQTKSPLGATLDEIKTGRLPEALKSVNQVLQSDAANANAHYLKAVICVLMRNFEEAKKEYDQTIKLSRNEQLTERAKLGLAKLER